MDKELIYTSKGNLPADELDYKTQWTDTENYTKFEEFYYLDDEVVKSSCHVYSKKPLESQVIQQTF